MKSRSLNMAAGIREFARSSPSRAAVVDGERVLTFAALGERSDRLASGLLAAGLRPGDPVAVLAGNRSEYFEVAAGLAKSGMPLVPLNPRNTEHENRFILEHSGARGMVLDDDLASRVSSMLETLPVSLAIGGTAAPDYETFLAQARPVDPAIDVDELDPFCIAYTSGTTGRPKGVLLTHRGRVLNNFASAIEWGLGPTRQTMAVAPLYHGAGFAFAYAAPQLGGTAHVLRSWDPAEFLRGLERSRTSTVFLVPTHAHQIRAVVPEPMRSYNLSALETLYFNAAALPVELKEWIHEAFPGVGIHELYGSTECAVVTDLRPEDSLRKAGSVGHPWFMNEVRLVDDNGDEVAAGVPGELFARSPMLMRGYLDDEESTRAAFSADGFVTVGDIAVRDEEGFISIVDRKKDVVIVGGINVFPREIEEVAVRHPAVADVAVVGVPDEVYGERVVGFVVRATDSVTPEELSGHAQEHLAKFKVPREWRFVDALPRNAGGKVLKRDLRDAYDASAEGIS